MVEVVAAANVPGPDDGAEEAPHDEGPQSPLAFLRAKRSTLKAELYLDLAIPRWQAEGRQLWVRYRPCSPAVFSSSAERRRTAWKKGDPDWQLRVNADLLVEACVAIYDLPEGTEPPEGELPQLADPYPTFRSEALSEAVGSSRNAAETCVATYLTEGDLLMAANQLLEWSGRASKKVDDRFLES
jgi:hypothetical protein